MKLVRFNNGVQTRLGVLSDQYVVDIEDALRYARGASVSLPTSMRAYLSYGDQARIDAQQALEYHLANPGGHFARLINSVQLLAPIDDPQKIICVGQNYRDHCAEQNQPLPERAIIFAKFPTAITGPNCPILLPSLSEKVDYEAELAFVIGKRARHVTEEQARDCVAGYMCLNDISARDIQYGDKQWVRAKTFDTFAPIGPAIVTPDEVGDPHTLDIELKLNGEVMQKSNTNNLVFGVYFLISYLSDVVTLEPGDIVTTGTPGGVGHFRQPPVYLHPGDVVTVTIERIGALTNPVSKE